MLNSILVKVLLICTYACFSLQKQVIDDFAKFDMLLKVKRGTKEEKYKVEVHKNNEGTFNLNQMEAYDS